MMFIIIENLMETEQLQSAIALNKKRHSATIQPRIDMTPMVDLGFLLVSFFIFTTTISSPHSMSLSIPPSTTINGSAIRESNALTLLLDKDNKVFVYEGRWQEAKQNNQVLLSGFYSGKGIADRIRQKQNLLDRNHMNGREDMVLMIKPGRGASYGNMIDALDEALINNVKRYVVMKPDPDETAWLDKNH